MAVASLTQYSERMVVRAAASVWGAGNSTVWRRSKSGDCHVASGRREFLSVLCIYPVIFTSNSIFTRFSTMKREPKLDLVDRRILQILQREARIANVDLARRVHLSPTPCFERMRRLEDS